MQKRRAFSTATSEGNLTKIVGSDIGNNFKCFVDRFTRCIEA